MTKEIIRLVPKVDDEINEDIIDILKESLVDAEAGKIQTIIVISTSPNGEWSHSMSGTDGITAAIVRLEITKQEWINRYIRSEVK